VNVIGRKRLLVGVAAVLALAVSVPALGAGDTTSSRGTAQAQKLKQCLKKRTPPKHRDCIPNSGAGAVRADFDGDGFSDLAIGIPNEDLGSLADAGAVQIVYGSSRGLVATGSQLFTQDTPDVLDEAEQADRFGAALAGGDFDADGFADLAIGVPGEDRELANRIVIRDHGAVNVLYGSAAGLTTAGNQLWSQSNPDIVDSAEPGDQYGSALAWGDLDTVAGADLVVGAPGEDRGVFEDAGGAFVIFGGSAGLAATDNTDASRPSGGDFIFRDGLRSGTSITTGNFAGDEVDDIAFGQPGFDEPLADDAGAVQIIVSRTFRSFSEGPRFHVSSISVQATPGAQLGTSLAAGNLLDHPNAPGFDELAAGAPFDDQGGADAAGSVLLLFGGAGSVGGPTFGPILTEADAGGVPETGDHFGLSLAIGNFDGAGTADLAVGVPGQRVGPAGDAGAVAVLYALDESGTPARRQALVQAGGETPEGGDGFGTALSAWNFNGDAFGDLAVGAPFENLGSIADAGAVNVFNGATGGLSAANVQLLTQANVPNDAPEPGDGFGFVMY
jgi:hypothetical protein